MKSHPIFIASIVLLSLYTGRVAAQDIRFSQYGYTPQVINPASIATDNFLAGYINYRSQRVDADLTLNTVAVFGKYPIFNKSNKRVAAVGVGFLSDRGEGLTDVNAYGLSGSFAYNLYLSESWAISSGLGLAYTRSEITLGIFTTGSQWIENRGFIPEVDTGERFDDLNTSYISFNGGLQLYREDDSGDVMHYLGISLFHFNQPDVSFLENDLEKPMRYSVQAGVRVFKNERYAVSPEVIAEQAGENAFVGIGANFTWHLEDNNPYDPFKKGSINLKVRNVVNEAVILALQFNQPGFGVGFSYDLGLSTDATEPNYNATEFAFAFKKRLFSKNKEEKKPVRNYSVREIRKFYSEEKEASQGTKEGNEGPDDIREEAFSGPVQFELSREFSFGFNEATLDREDELYLNDMASLLKLNPGLMLEIEGHADNIGTEHANKKISVERAKVVRDYLISQGIDKKRIKATGKGSKEPLVPNDSEANRAKNRRVEFSIYKK